MADLKTLDYAYLGQPYCDGKNDPDIDLNTLDYALDAQPFTGDIIGGIIEPPLSDDFVPWITIF